MEGIENSALPNLAIFLLVVLLCLWLRCHMPHSMGNKGLIQRGIRRKFFITFFCKIIFTTTIWDFPCKSSVDRNIGIRKVRKLFRIFHLILWERKKNKSAKSTTLCNFYDIYKITNNSTVKPCLFGYHNLTILQQQNK